MTDDGVHLRAGQPRGRDVLVDVDRLVAARHDERPDPDDPVREVLTTAPANGAPIGGLKVDTEPGWFAARPSGTEDVLKVYAESLHGEDHFARVLQEAQGLAARALPSAAAPGAR